MSLLGLFTGCKSQNTDGDSPNKKTKKEIKMPQSKLLRVEYNYSGMMMEPFYNIELYRNEEGKGPQLKFETQRQEYSFEVSDTLFDAARRIIEEEKMYEYGVSYELASDIQVLDGYAWRFYARFENKEENIDSRGHQVSPNGNGLNRMRQLLYDAAEKCMEKAHPQQP